MSGEPIGLKEAALLTLKNSPSIKQLKLQLQSSQAALQITRGSFDINASLIASANENRPTLNSSGLYADIDSHNLTGSLSKMFRTGIVSSLSVTLGRMDPRYVPGFDTTNTSNANLNLVFPLLKGRGRGGSAAAVAETAAQLNSEATQLDYYHNLSQILLSTINAYWDYQAAVVNLGFQQTSEQRVQKLLSEVKGLKAKEADVSRLKGYYSDKRRNTIEAVEQVNTARSALAIVMGLPAEQVANLGEPVEEFSLDWDPILNQLEQQPMEDKWVATAIERRLDVQAQKLRQQASAIQLAKARQDLQPQLDLGLNLGYNGQELGNDFNNYFDSLAGDERGTTTSATLTLSYPLGNNIAKGSLDIADVTHQSAVITTNNQIRTTSVQVGVDAGIVMRRLQESVEAKKAVESYFPAYEQSYRRLLESPSTLFVLIDVEEKLTEAFVNQVNTLQELGKAIAKLRFETGTILVPGDEENLILANMTTLPNME